MESHNLNLYHIFYITALQGSISKAAKELFISQPAVSKGISRLENNLGVSLFIRNSRGVKLTGEGKLLYEQLAKAFMAIREGENTLKKISENGAGELTIGASTMLCKYILLPYLKDFMQKNPNIKISLTCLSSNDSVNALHQGQLDIALVAEVEHMEGIIFRPLQELHDTFVASKEYLDSLCRQADMQGVLTPERTVTLFSYANLFMLDLNNSTRQFVDNYMFQHGIRAKQQMETTSVDLLIEFAKLGLGITCVNADFIKTELQEKSLIALQLPVPVPPRKIGIAYKSKRKPTYAMQKFMEYIFSNT